MPGKFINCHYACIIHSSQRTKTIRFSFFKSTFNFKNAKELHLSSASFIIDARHPIDPPKTSPRRASYCTILTAKIKAERSQLERLLLFFSLSLVKHRIPIHPRHTQSTFIVGRGIHPFTSTGALYAHHHILCESSENRVFENISQLRLETSKKKV